MDGAKACPALFVGRAKTEESKVDSVGGVLGEGQQPPPTN